MCIRLLNIKTYSSLIGSQVYRRGSQRCEAVNYDSPSKISTDRSRHQYEWAQDTHAWIQVMIEELETIAAIVKEV